NAGHMAPLLRHGGGQVEAIGEEQIGPPLGVALDFTYQSYRWALQPGETLLLYSDGISEAMNDQGEWYGLERLRACLAGPTISLAALGRTILDDVRSFVNGRPPVDDMSLVGLRRDDAVS